MKKIFILLFLAFTSVFAILPGGNVAPTVIDDGFSNVVKSVQDYSVGAKKRIDDTTNEIFNGGKVESFFEDVSVTSCKDIKKLMCPPLAPKYSKEHVTMIDYINPKAGELKCSVFEKGDIFDGWKKDFKIAPIYSQVFKKDACVQEFSDTNNIDSSDDIKILKEKVEKREQELNDMQLKYSVDFKTSGGEKYLDLGDWLDALATIDAEKIDIQKTLAQNQVHTTPGYTTIPNATVVSEFQTALKSLMIKNHGNIKQSQVDEMIKNSTSYDEKNLKIANSKYVMYLDFFVKSNKAINETINMLLVVFLLWNILGKWIWSNATNKWSGNQNNENHIGRIVFGVITLVVFYTGSANKIEVTTTDGTKSEVEYKSQRIQDVLRAVYGITNNLADKLTEIAISSYLKSLASTSGIVDVAQINSLSSEKLVNEKELTYLQSIENECAAAYDPANIDSYLREYRKKTMSQKDVVTDTGLVNGEHSFSDSWEQTKYDLTGGFFRSGQSSLLGKDMRWSAQQAGETGTLNVNPYPFSEREAMASLDDKKIKPYNNNGNGYVKAGYFTGPTFIGNGNQWLSLSGCSYNRKQLILNKSRHLSLSASLNDIKMDENFNDKFDRIKNVNDIMWKNFAELGYVSIAFLPATAVLLEKKAGVGDNVNTIVSGDTDTQLQTVSKMIPMLSLFNGSAIAGLYENVTPAGKITSMLSSTLGGIPIVGGLLKGVTDATAGVTIKVLSYGLAYLTIDSVLNATVLIVFITGGILAFIILTLQKLWTFFAVLFVIIYAFSPNQEEKIAGVLGKMGATAFKTVLLVVSMFIAIWSLSLVDSMEHILVNDFFSNMQNLVDAPIGYLEEASQGLVRYSFFGVSHVVFIIVKIILSVTIIFKLPSYFFDILDVKAEDVGDRMQEVIQQAQERESMKGM